MNDVRVEFADLAGGDESAVVDALDRIRIVIDAPAERAEDYSDQVALYTLVNLCARLFPHIDIRIDGEPTGGLPLLGPGWPLADELIRLARDLAPPSTRDPETDLHLAFGQAATGEGVAGDASGWTYSIGAGAPPPIDTGGGPAVGAIACASFLAAQAFGRALARLGMPFHPADAFVSNLLTYANEPAPAVAAAQPAFPAASAVLGCGSVGSSGLLAAVLSGAVGDGVDLVDPDRFSERNVLRYPVLRRRSEQSKARWLAALARDAAGIGATGHVTDVNGYLNRHSEPPVLDLALVSVDTVEGRRDAVDALARTTLNAGVAGLALHCSSHGFGAEGCAYCAYVDVAPTLSGAQLLAEQIGLQVDRVVALELGDGVITEADAAVMAAGGRFGDQPPRAGERLADLRRRIYAQAKVPTADGAPALVSAPFVSMFAGLLLFAEAIKLADDCLADYHLQGRVDFDMSGQPPGLTRAPTRDTTGRCLCHSGFRRRAYRQLHQLAA